MSNLAQSYAKALFELAVEKDITHRVMQQAGFINQVLADNPPLVKFLKAPVVAPGEKTEAADKIFKGSVDNVLLNFIKVMAERKNMDVLSESLEEYESMYNRHYGIEKAVAVTALPLNENLYSKLKEKLEKITGKKIQLINKVDESCIGGIVLHLEGMRIDDSISTKLESLKKQLKTIAE